MKDNQPKLAARIVEEPWSDQKPDHIEKGREHGRIETRSITVRPVAEDKPLPGFPDARQMGMIIRERMHLDGTPMNDALQIVFVITSLSATEASPRDIAMLVRGHWAIENKLHHVRDVTFDEDRSRVRTGWGPRNMAAFRNLAIGIHRLNKSVNIAEATRACCFSMPLVLRLLCARPARSRKACA